jgi:hypothetical protein
MNTIWMRKWHSSMKISAVGFVQGPDLGPLIFLLEPLSKNFLLLQRGQGADLKWFIIREISLSDESAIENRMILKIVSKVDTETVTSHDINEVTITKHVT